MRPPARQQTHIHETNRHEAKRPSSTRLLYILYVVGYTEIELSRLYLASYDKARGHDETPARQQSHRHEVMRPKATDLQSQKVIVVCSVLIAQIGYPKTSL